MARLVQLKSGGEMHGFPGCNSIAFSPEQRELCKTDRKKYGLSLMRVLARASLATALECERQFQGSRWNCTRFTRGPLFGRGLFLKGEDECFPSGAVCNEIRSS